MVHYLIYSVLKQHITVEILGNPSRQWLNINAAINAFDPAQLVFTIPNQIVAKMAPIPLLNTTTKAQEVKDF